MERLGNYELQKELGRGATAKIYLARHLDTHALVSLKVFHPRLFNEVGFAQRIQREMQVSASLNHPNIVGVREAIQTDPPALVMDYVDGENLEKFQSRLPYVLPEISALIVIEILKALEYAHAKNLIHRDLKPENVLIQRDGQVFVTDFGLAKYTNTTMITQTNVILGSLDYMSPEQAQGDSLTALSDLFSVGLILYFLTTGTRPFSRPNAVATLTAIREENAEPVQKCNPKISGELARIIQKSIEKEPTKRFQTAQEFRQALSNYLGGVGFGEGVFDFAMWNGNATAFTIEGLRVAAEAVTHQCELALRDRRWDALLENLAHLSLKAPQSAALGRITQEYLNVKKRGRRAWLPRVAILLVLLAGTVALRPWRFIGQGSVAPTAVPAPIVAPQIPPSPQGTVIFKVGADVKIVWDGKEVNPDLPLTGQRIGEHQLVLKREGFQPISTKVKVKADEPLVVNAK